ncbi:MAG: lipoprotein [Ectothiorhodospiraceae bacterium]|jgi:predicted small lipoprotein YifL
MFRRLLVITLLALLLAACGRKGDLYLPEPQQKPQNTQQDDS